MGLANAFSGGLFLAIALVQVLPEVTHQYDEYTKRDEKDHDHTDLMAVGGMIVQHMNHLHLLINGVM